MNNGASTWQEEHDRLIHRIARERMELAARLQAPSETVDRLQEKTEFLKKNLPFILLPLAVILLLRPRRALGLLMRGWGIYRLLLSVKRGMV
jgi:YqjK-like protein